jgi:hypothetical protein
VFISNTPESLEDIEKATAQIAAAAAKAFAERKKTSRKGEAPVTSAMRPNRSIEFSIFFSWRLTGQGRSSMTTKRSLDPVV